MTLSEGGLVLTFKDNTQIKVNDTIDFKPTDEASICVGKITELRHPGHHNNLNKDSVWMAVSDIMTGNTNWVPCIVWKEQSDGGMFKHKPTSGPAVVAAVPETKQQPVTNQPVQYANPEQSSLPQGESDLW